MYIKYRDEVSCENEVRIIMEENTYNISIQLNIILNKTTVKGHIGYIWAKYTRLSNKYKHI